MSYLQQIHNLYNNHRLSLLK